MANLLEKANILITPTAYSDGKIHSAKPIQSLSAEKVVNGDFENGSTDWTLQNGWTINGDKAVVTNAPSLYQRLTQSLNFNLNSNYKISIVCSEYSSGFVYLRKPRGTESDTSLRIDNVGTFVFNLKALTELTEFALAIGSLGTDLTIDNISVKEVIDSDLNFTRGSAGTRVNAQGLIESVDTLGSEAVSNGNFEELGNEKVTNGDFVTDSDWSKGSGWSISDGMAIGLNVPNTQRIQNNGATSIVGKTYKYSFDASNISGNYTVYIYGAIVLNSVSLEGIVTGQFIATSTNGSFYIAGATLEGLTYGNFTNISVKQVDPNDDWNPYSAWTVSEGKATAFDSGLLQNTGSLTVGKNYEATFEIIDYTSGNVKVYSGAGSDSVPYYSSIGVHTFNFIANASNIFAYSDNFIGSISNVSVKEVIDVTNIPRINYKDGVGSWLIEPQSTNLIEYSSNFSKSAWSKQSGITPTYNTTETLSPDGTYNATKFIGNGSAGVYSFGSAVGVVSRAVYLKSIIGTVNIILKDPALTVTLKTITVTTEWQRFDLIEDNGHSSSSGIWVSNIPVSGIYMWGASLEQQSYPTSYIPTNGSVQTRLAETASRSGLSDLIDSTEGVLYAEIAALANDGTYRTISISNGTTSDRINIWLWSDGTLKVDCYRSSNPQFTFDINTNLTSINKIAVKYKINDFSLWINGLEVATDTSGQPPIGLNELNFSNGNTLYPFYGKAKCVALFPILTDEELECLTTR